MDALTKPRTGTRRKVLKDETAKPAELAKSNGPDPDTVLMWHGLLKADQAAVDAAKKRLAKRWKLAINDGIVREDLQRALKLGDMAPEQAFEKVQREQFYAKVLGLPIGHQMSLFDVPQSAIPTHGEMSERAKKSGYARGLMGENPDGDAYPAGHDHHQAHMEGWHAGQAVLLDRIKPIEIAMSSEGRPGKAKSTPDAADHISGGDDGDFDDDGGEQ